MTVYLAQVSAIVEFLDTYTYYSKPNVCRHLNGWQLHNKCFLMTAGAFLRTSGNKGRHFWSFWTFLVFRELKSEQKQPFYASLKSNSTILDPIMSQCGLEMHKLLSKYIWIWLQIGVKWLFLVWFEVSKDPKRPNLSSFIARNPQNFPSSHKKKSFRGA